MRAVFRKDINDYLSHFTGYLVIGLFLLFNGLMLWGFRNSLNIIETGYADLVNFFESVPWLLIFLIPALSMRAFSEEYRSGTMELLLTKPLRIQELIAGKFLAVTTIVVISLLPTFIYVFSITSLAYQGSPDMGAIAGSYMGLLLLSIVFAAVSIWASSISRTQISAFLLGLSMNFILYWVLEQVHVLYPGLPGFLGELSLYTHFKSIGRGVIDTRDLVYMASITFFFLYLTYNRLQYSFRYKKILPKVLLIGLFLIVIQFLSSKIFKRWDLTSDKRFTLSPASLSELKADEGDIYIKVYLKGDFPPAFDRLSKATRRHLEELQARSNRIHFRFVSPEGNEKKLIEKGMIPSRLTVEEQNSISEKIIFPWAEMSLNGKTTLVSLLPNTSGGIEQQMENASGNLEYAFTGALHRLQQKEKKSIAVLRGNKELENIYLVDFLSELRNRYHLAQYRLDSSSVKGSKFLEGLLRYDALIIAKPRIAFTETQKYILDQYIVNGGKTLWLLDYTTADMDSLRKTGESVVISRDLQLTDLLFSYGVRIHHDLVQDAYSAPIALATGEVGGKPQYQTYPWTYYPLIQPVDKHPITKNLDPIRLKFPSSMDTLKNKLHKTVLLSTSSMSRLTGMPAVVSLQSITRKPTPDTFNKGKQILGVLIEGIFPSAYTYKTKPFSSTVKIQPKDNKMIVVSDGDIIANELKNGSPSPMDIDPWTGMAYGNKNFLLNALDYLTDDSGIIRLRGKIRKDIPLNKEKITLNKLRWQLINIAGPILLLSVFGVFYSLLRKRKYSK